MKPQFYTIEKSNDQTEEIVVFIYEDGSTLQLSKAHYEELEAAKNVAK